ncbi:hypothetical protein EUX98_g7516 [Antrodiella citrinella]|uniref:Uncharacterized protein n=1 Tax=Antrodiella citrinella TaxID=2447956 RepID=A0A4S4MLB9_9APHY|nr:hypothetical protein EUX98_g7516 [Antrodiella citrinella]
MGEDHQCTNCGITGNIGVALEDWDSVSAQLKTVFYFIQGLREWNFDLLESTLSDDYQMETCKEANILEPGYRVDIIDVNESPGRIWIHVRTLPSVLLPADRVASVQATVYARAKIGQSYENEYLLMFRLTTNESGEPKIRELKEFMDSLYTTNFALAVGRKGQLCMTPATRQAA